MYVATEWYLLLPSGVCCNRVAYVVAECCMLAYVVAVWCMLWPSGVCCGRVVYTMAVWCML